MIFPTNYLFKFEETTHVFVIVCLKVLVCDAHIKIYGSEADIVSMQDGGICHLEIR